MATRKATKAGPTLTRLSPLEKKLATIRMRLVEDLGLDELQRLQSN